MKQINSPIVGATVLKVPHSPPQPTALAGQFKRPVCLSGSTYRIKNPGCESAVYVTINNIEVHGRLRPFEMFVASKNMEHFQWVTALTRVVSAVFRQTDNVAFLVEELRSVFDPGGGYFRPGGKYTASLVAEIGECLETHLLKIGAAVPVVEREKLLRCPKCNSPRMVSTEGCMTCTSCGYSKCS